MYRWIILAEEVDGDAVRIGIEVVHFGPQASGVFRIGPAPSFQMACVDVTRNPFAQGCLACKLFPPTTRFSLANSMSTALANRGEDFTSTRSTQPKGIRNPRKLAGDPRLMATLEAVELFGRIVPSEILVDQHMHGAAQSQMALSADLSSSSLKARSPRGPRPEAAAA